MPTLTPMARRMSRVSDRSRSVRFPPVACHLPCRLGCAALTPGSVALVRRRDVARRTRFSDCVPGNRWPDRSAGQIRSCNWNIFRGDRSTALSDFWPSPCLSLVGVLSWRHGFVGSAITQSRPIPLLPGGASRKTAPTAPATASHSNCLMAELPGETPGRPQAVVPSDELFLEAAGSAGSGLRSISFPRNFVRSGATAGFRGPQGHFMQTLQRKGGASDAVDWLRCERTDHRAEFPRGANFFFSADSTAASILRFVFWIGTSLNVGRTMVWFCRPWISPRAGF